MAKIAICTTNWWNNEVEQSEYAAQFPGLSAWITSSRAATLSEPEMVEILGNDWSTVGYDTVNGASIGPPWVTSAANYISISCVGLARHLGNWDPNRYVLRLLYKGAYNLTLNVDNIIIDGLQFKPDFSASYTANGIVASLRANGKPVIRNNIFKTTHTISGTMVFVAAQGGGATYNNLIIGTNHVGIGLNTQYTSTHDFYNNTVIGFDKGFLGYGSALKVHNNLVWDCTTPYTGVYAANANHNAYNSGTDPGSNGIDLSGYTVTDIFNDPTNEDYSLKESAIMLRQKGTNLSEDPDTPFTTDIAGQVRPALPDLWDIGAWHFTGDPVGDLVKIKIQNLVLNSRVLIEKNSDGSPVGDPFQATSSYYEVDFEYFEDTLITIFVRRSSPALGQRYRPYQANAIVGSRGVTVYIDQQIDDIAAE